MKPRLFLFLCLPICVLASCGGSKNSKSESYYDDFALIDADSFSARITDLSSVAGPTSNNYSVSFTLGLTNKEVK